MPVTRWMDELRDDVRFAARQLRRSPAFTLVAVTTLALGIGANSAIFALVDAALLRPLPYREPERLVMFWERNERSPRASVAPLNLLDWRERGRTLEQVGAYVPRVGGMVMAGESGAADTVSRQWVTFGIFDVLGVEPILGRTFQPEDDAQQRNVVVLGESFWRTRFGGDPGIVGRDLRLDGEPYTVVGVVPKEFQLLGGTSLWALASFERTPENRRARGFAAVGRLRPGTTIEAARGDVSAVAEQLAREFPETNAGRGVTMEPLQHALVGRELRLTSLLFLGVVGFVLLICCANVANLMLARATVRSRELAIRTALGAGQGRVMRQLLTESLLLSALGGLVGLAVGAAILRAIPSLVPEGLLPAAVRPEFDARVGSFCAFVALLVGLLFGAAPGWKASRQSAARVIAAQGRTTTGRGGRTRAALVVAEVATAVVVLFGAGLLLRTLLAVESVDRGYRAREVLTMVVDPIGSRYPTPLAMRQFYDAVEHEVRSVPGVRSVAWATTLPFGPSYVGRTTFELAGEPLEPAKRPSADYQIVSLSYFETVELAVVAGRNFDARDHDAAVPVCIVNEAFVKSQLAGRSPIGARVSLPTGPRPQDPMLVREIVGVARQVKGRPDEAEDMLQLYVPITQHVIDDVFLVVRPASGRADAYAAPVRAAIGRVDREQLVSVRGVTTLEEIASGAVSRHRFRAVMVTTFAALALVLALVGVFGILAYSVQQRVRDFAVRRALGATSADVVRLVTASAVRVVAAGVVIGLLLSAALGRLLSTLLFGVQPLDPATFALVTLLLLAGAALSTAAPALRAARIEPAVALRDE